MNKVGILPFILLVITLFSGTIIFAKSGQSGYSLTSTLISKALYLDVDIAGDHIVALGERGHIVLSSNGNNWVKAQTPSNSTLTAIYFFDNRHGWAVGHDAIILKTSDGGYSWHKVYSDASEEAPLLDIWFSNKTEGIAIGAYGLYLTTSDGGRTWNREEINIVNKSGADESEESTDKLIDLYDLHLNAIEQAANGKLYIVAEAGRIYRSEDLGQSWTTLPSPYIGSLFGLLTLDSGSLLVFGLRGHLYRSEDEGNTWHQIEVNTRELLTAGIKLDTGEIVICGMGGTLVISRDDGKSFSSITQAGRLSFSAIEETAFGKLVLVGDQGIKLLNKPGREGKL